MDPIYTVISSGQAVGGDIDLRQRRIHAIAVPAIDSADLLVRGGFDATSANFVRLVEARTPASGDLRFATAAGSRMIAWPAGVPLPPYVRFEAGVAQTDNRTLTLLTGPR